MIKIVIFLAACVFLGAEATGAPLDHGKIVSCYYSSWAFYRKSHGQFDVEDIDTKLCTHVFYGFADLNNVTWRVYPYDPWFDMKPGECPPNDVAGYCCQEGYCNYGSYDRFVNLKKQPNQNPNVKAMISIGGWNAGSGKYSLMAKDPAKRSIFVKSVREFLDYFGFDGVDMDWEYPGYRIGTDPEDDKNAFTDLIEELRAELGGDYLLTAALGCGYDKVLVAYDLDQLPIYLDFINLMTYDYHGAWANFTGHNSPLYRRPEETYEGHPGYKYNVYDSVELYLDKRVPAEKLVLGVPTYSRGFEVSNADENGLYCPADLGNPAGPYTRQRGTLGYNEILELVTEKNYTDKFPDFGPGDEFTVVVDGCYKAPYMYFNKYWIGYDDPDSVAYKVRYANLNGLGGIMVWSLETDDFEGAWSTLNYPILRRVNDELSLGQPFDPAVEGCSSAPMCDDYIITTTTIATTTTTATTTAAATTTTTEGTVQCNDQNCAAVPGDCSKYYRCGEGGQLQGPFNCNDGIFNPNDCACINKCDGLAEDLCPGGNFDC